MPNSINYFKYFPQIVYNNKSVVDITRRTKIVEQLYSSPLSFLSYTIKDGERPEDIALYYYGDIGKVWLVFLANNIIDPSSEWPLNITDFNNMIALKYAKQAGTTVYSDVIAWARSTIHHYENSDGLKINKDTYNLDNSFDIIVQSEWSPIRIYDYELKLNENKRNIFLFNNTYAAQAESELKELLSV